MNGQRPKTRTALRIKGCNIRRKNERIQKLEPLPQVLTVHICSLPISFTASSLQVACLFISVWWSSWYRLKNETSSLLLLGYLEVTLGKFCKSIFLKSPTYCDCHFDYAELSQHVLHGTITVTTNSDCSLGSHGFLTQECSGVSSFMPLFSPPFLWIHFTEVSCTGCSKTTPSSQFILQKKRKSINSIGKSAQNYAQYVNLSFSALFEHPLEVVHKLPGLNRPQVSQV